MIGPEKFKKIYSSDGLPEKDEFQRKGFAQRIVTTILQQPLGECLVVSIVGPWGSGKTTVLEYVYEEISSRTAKEGTCQIAPFNPWRFAGEDVLLFELFDSLVKAIDPDESVLKPWQKFKEKLSKYSNSVATGAGVCADVKMPGSGQVVSSLIQSFLPSDLRMKIDEVRIQAANYLREKGKRVVVLLDDVDRLDASDILLLFRTIKLIADLPNTTFVMAMDEDHVGQVIGERINRTPEAGRKYIEKIVNVRIGLPAIPHHILSDYTLRLLSEVYKKTAYFFPDGDLSRVRDVFQKLHAPFIKTPRTAKSIQNAFAFALGLLSEEVNAGDVMLLEATRLLHPHLYEELKTVIPNLGPRMYVADYYENVGLSEADKKQRVDSMWKRLLVEFDQANESQLARTKDALKKWFPQLLDGAARQEDKQEWSEAKRACSKNYFWRYFSGAIQSDDVRDDTVKEWMRSAKSNESSADSQLKIHLEAPYGRAFLAKLENICSTQGSNSGAVMRILSKAGSQLVSVKKEGLVGSVRERSAILAGELVANINNEARESVVLDCFNLSCDLSWSFDMWQHIPDKLMKTFTNVKENKSVEISTIHLKLANQSLDRYESGAIPDSNELIFYMIGAISNNIAHKKLKMRLKKIVKQVPLIGLHLLIAGCAFATSRTSNICWRWEEPDCSNALKPLLDQKTLSIAVTKALAKKPISDMEKQNFGSGRYYSFEQIGWMYLHSLKSLSKGINRQKAQGEA